MFTLEATDLELPGPLPLRFFRVYSSAMRKRDVGLGYGWAHNLGWEIEVRRRDIRVWNEQGAFLTFDSLDVGAEQQGRFGWVLRRHARGYVLDTDLGVWRHFEQSDRDGERWRLSRVADRNGNTIVLQYDDRGHLAHITDSAGRQLRTSPDASGRFQSLQVAVTSRADAAAAQPQGQAAQWHTLARYQYDSAGHLLVASDADGDGSAIKTEHIRFVWDGNVLVHELRTSLDGRGQTTTEQRTYVFEDDSYVAMAHSRSQPGQQSQQWLHYVNDSNGSPQRLLDDAGEVANELLWSAWGQVECEHSRTNRQVNFETGNNLGAQGGGQVQTNVHVDITD